MSKQVDTAAIRTAHTFQHLSRNSTPKAHAPHEHCKPRSLARGPTTCMCRWSSKKSLKLVRSPRPSADPSSSPRQEHVVFG